ncbi:hypothetical protein EJ05DRAFT_537234 [Pseudovirgaria hyperparasitica]|uniref:Mid2 domain-containing protein n=1 Tax=Pseudovirgaria hyperparasitica TaxID=470096 RepID=A0A6A6W9W8_9PEZI|nr:uncharacterized protein EJ05DRAFT_537234 [Pseudovirgaria hyperparasitica]KAF2758824.1 hypothetical protein EJ05DRAFT_537234 [Pseudovirgaria hyperparasitica]
MRGLLVFSFLLLFQYVPMAGAEDGPCDPDVDPLNCFLNPPAAIGKPRDYENNSRYYRGSILQIIYYNTMNYSYDIIIYQEGTPQGDTIFQNIEDQGTIRKNWKVDTQEDLARGNVFFFSVLKRDGSGNLVNSAYFNISEPDPETAVSSTVLTSTMQSNMATEAPQTLSLNTQPTTITSTTISRPATTSSLPLLSSQPVLATATKVGMGVGLGLGVPLMGLLGVGIFYMGRRSKRRARETQNTYQQGYGYPPVYHESRRTQYHSAWEMPAEVPISEAPPKRYTIQELEHVE